MFGINQKSSEQWEQAIQSLEEKKIVLQKEITGVKAERKKYQLDAALEGGHASRILENLTKQENALTVQIEDIEGAIDAAKEKKVQTIEREQQLESQKRADEIEKALVQVESAVKQLDESLSSQVPLVSHYSEAMAKLHKVLGNDKPGSLDTHNIHLVRERLSKHVFPYHLNVSEDGYLPSILGRKPLIDWVTPGLESSRKVVENLRAS